MEYNAFTPSLGQNDTFSASPLLQQQKKHQQQHQHHQHQPDNTIAHLMYQSGQYPSTAAPTPVSTNMMNRRSLQVQPYTSTWSALGDGNMAKMYPPPTRTMTTDGSQRPVSLTATSMRHLGMQPPQLQAGFMQPQLGLERNSWGRKSFAEVDISSLEPEMNALGQGAMLTDEDGPVVDLRQLRHFDRESAQDISSRRMSESSYSMSSNGPFLEIPSMEDFGTSEVSYTSECDFSSLEPTSQNSSFSPATSPRLPTQDLIRSGSRSRASPNPHNNMRTSPYTLESNRNKRWSTGMCAPPTTPRPTPNPNRFSSFYGAAGSPLNPHNGLASFTNDSGMTTFAAPGQSLFYSQHRSNPHGTFFSSANFPDPPRQLPSQSLFRLLPSNSDRLNGTSHFHDMSDPPDLYSSLHEEPSNPPESDMNPSDPDLIPHEQDLRFPGDMYTPRWVRGHGNKREGWCGLCKPGRWLVLKNSAFWYDKSFTHGVSAATGAAFQEPTITRRTEGNSDVWEGLCGGCGDWVSLVSSKKKGTTWFRHAYKCHTHAKVKDGPKRRRETTTNIRARAASVTSTSYPSLMTNPTDMPSQQESTHDTTPSAPTITTTSDTPTASGVSTQYSGDRLSPSSGPSPKTMGVNTSGPPVEQIVELVLDGHEDHEPLTATRLSMDMDQGKYNFDEQTMQSESHHPVQADMDSDFSRAMVENSSDNTPLSTPQLSNTTMSTPQMDAMGGGLGMPMGLGVQGIDMGFDHQRNRRSVEQPLNYSKQVMDNPGSCNNRQYSGNSQQEMNDQSIFKQLDMFDIKQSHSTDKTQTNLGLGQEHDSIMSSMHATIDSALIGFGGVPDMNSFADMI